MGNGDNNMGLNVMRLYLHSYSEDLQQVLCKNADYFDDHIVFGMVEHTWVMWYASR